MDPLSTLKGFPRYGLIFKIIIFRHETWNLKKVPEVVLFLPQRVEMELTFALRAAVSEIWADFQIAIFGHGTWNLNIVPEVAYGSSFFPRGRS